MDQDDCKEYIEVWMEICIIVGDNKKLIAKFVHGRVPRSSEDIDAHNVKSKNTEST